MIVTYRVSGTSGYIKVSDDLLPFMFWLSVNRDNKDAAAICQLIAEHASETDAAERANIVRTLTEILSAQPTTATAP
jgi:hypothetical protein